jgi:LDH2 family malate/lactate/ureidoglycolate dehydrogenase
MDLINAQNTFGFLAACMAIDEAVKIATTYGVGIEAVKMATTYGVGIVAVKNSGHYGMGGMYSLRATEKGFGAMAFTNASRSMPAGGSKEPLLGTSPFAVELPGGQHSDFLLDMSPSVVARVGLHSEERKAIADILSEQDPESGAPK